ncbi:enoyl-CoA hydratase/carnithine racemase [Lipingzhangella halophila]|uniref:Enoyl-CoA hydratase/carnithine racemase n=1 Tax=Lipingzhangella halophila TaxID=1783352 RepID=A0A7W7W5S8_9ACTN|nr:enoyl-CoA hydratase/isomerase family protein [Lipingzhangella halophila]MBB4935023.1 enoyl-CoA hydratase/carnithine racemase [Lipingzhangella halophila]
MTGGQPASDVGTDELLVSVDGPVLTVTFNRPSRHNAMTWAMYDGLVEACEQADRDDDVRAMVLTGAGEKAFVAGTDIGQFAEFEGGADGVAYEEHVDAVINRLIQVDKPTVAAVSGYCVGAGLGLAAACDLRVATQSAQFGVPIARTLGNCLAPPIQALLVHHLGPTRTMDLLLTARLLSAEEADGAGFLTRLVADGELDSATRELTERLAGHAPLTMWAAKETTRRFLAEGVPDGTDIVDRVYGSEDFRSGVAAFTSGRRSQWRGR